LAEVIFEKQPAQAVTEIQMEELDDFFMNDWSCVHITPLFFFLI
jgi:hypothetical protein